MTSPGPDGRPVRRGRRRLLGTGAVVAAVVAVGVALAPAVTGTAPAGAARPGTATTTGTTTRATTEGGADGAAPAQPTGPVRSWVGTWATAVAVPERGAPLTGFRDATVRQRLHVSLGGDTVRVRLTNRYGTRPLTLTATLALPSTVPGSLPGDVDRTTLVPVTFGGGSTAVLAPGADRVSDPVRLDVPDDGDVMLSLHLPGPTGPATYHASAHTTGYLARGDRTLAPTVAPFGRRTTSYWFVDGLDVRSTARGAVVFLGDSITDGAASTQDADHRWPDLLADRVRTAAPGQRFGVLNVGIGGNRVLRDAHSPGQGVRALDRFTHDVLDRSGVETVVVLEGVNDLQQDPSEVDTRGLVAGYRELMVRARERHVRVVVCTIAPFEGWGRWSPQREAVRRGVNHWIRTSGEPDAVIDFDAVLRDPARPTRLRAAYDSGDHLHPGDAGYAAMAAAVDLGALRNPRR